MLLKNENQIIRVLKSQGNKALVIDCIKRTMPKWVDGDSLSNYDDCGEDEMYERTDYPFGRELTLKEERIAQERFTMIAGVLPYIGNEQKRSQMIDFLAEHQSKQTIRKYLCLYLVYQDIDVLAPPPRAEKELSKDEKNMRWALNKFFYTKNKNSLMTAYRDEYYYNFSWFYDIEKQDSITASPVLVEVQQVEQTDDDNAYVELNAQYERERKRVAQICQKHAHECKC